MIAAKNDIAMMLKISRPTLDKWIRDGFITPVQSSVVLDIKIFRPNQILEQLQNQKNKK